MTDAAGPAQGEQWVQRRNVRHPAKSWSNRGPIDQRGQSDQVEQSGYIHDMRALAAIRENQARAADTVLVRERQNLLRRHCPGYVVVDAAANQTRYLDAIDQMKSWHGAAVLFAVSGFVFFLTISL